MPAHQLEGEVGFHRGADVGGAAGEDAPTTICILFAEDFGYRPLHSALVAGAQQGVHHDVVGFEGGVCFQFPTPVAVGVLAGEDEIPRSRDG